MGSTTYGSIRVDLSRDLTEEEWESWIVRCKTVPAAPEADRYQLDRYDPEGWSFGDDGLSWSGDGGVVYLEREGFSIEVSGKVYDLVDAVAHFLASLPPDVTATGATSFETEGEHWGIRVDGREVREVEAQVVIEPHLSALYRIHQGVLDTDSPGDQLAAVYEILAECGMVVP